MADNRKQTVKMELGEEYYTPYVSSFGDADCRICWWTGSKQDLSLYESGLVFETPTI